MGSSPSPPAPRGPTPAQIQATKAREAELERQRAEAERARKEAERAKRERNRKKAERSPTSRGAVKTAQRATVLRAGSDTDEESVTTSRKTVLGK